MKMSFQQNKYLYMMFSIFSEEENLPLSKTAFARSVKGFFKLEFKVFLAQMFHLLPQNILLKVFRLENILKR